MLQTELNEQNIRFSPTGIHVISPNRPNETFSFGLVEPILTPHTVAPKQGAGLLPEPMFPRYQLRTDMPESALAATLHKRLTNEEILVCYMKEESAQDLVVDFFMGYEYFVGGHRFVQFFDMQSKLVLKALYQWNEKRHIPTLLCLPGGQYLKGRMPIFRERGYIKPYTNPRSDSSIARCELFANRLSEFIEYKMLGGPSTHYCVVGGEPAGMAAYA